MMRSWPGRLAAVATIGLLVLAPVRADAPGVLWQTTSQMVMEGLPFSPPPTSLKVCTPAVWTRPPPGGDPSCVTTNYRRVGNKATWAMQCSGEMPMTGTGEMTFADDGSYTGVITANADGMSMTIRLSGKKIGTCDNPID
ncbi:MAG: DUF3617 family protein [Steroidobacteraceae bacterium]|nr:DUF3617 family protein [Steroidobacteraceae bacterium]